MRTEPRTLCRRINPMHTFSLIRSGGTSCVFLWGFLLMVGCLGDVGEEAAESGSILNVEDINAYYDAEDATAESNQVDVVQGLCRTGEGEEVTYEPEWFSDHYLRVTITNRPLPNRTKEEQTASPVEITSYTVTYSPQPVRWDVPPLEPYVGVPLQDTQVIEPCEPESTCEGTEYIGLTLMNLDKKDEYVEKVCGDSRCLDTPPTVPYPDLCEWYPSPLGGYCPWTTHQGQYTAHYTFLGENIFGKKVSCNGDLSFFVHDYDHCED